MCEKLLIVHNVCFWYRLSAAPRLPQATAKTSQPAKINNRQGASNLTCATTSVPTQQVVVPERDLTFQDIHRCMDLFMGINQKFQEVEQQQHLFRMHDSERQHIFRMQASEQRRQHDAYTQKTRHVRHFNIIDCMLTLRIYSYCVFKVESLREEEHRSELTVRQAKNKFEVAKWDVKTSYFDTNSGTAN